MSGGALSNCDGCEELADLTSKHIELVEFVKRVYLNDKSGVYRYGEKRPSDDKKPSKGSRWMTPKELAESIIQRHKIILEDREDSCK